MTRDQAGMRAKNAIERIRRKLRLVSDMLESDLHFVHGSEAAEMARQRLDALEETIQEEEAIHGVAIHVLINGGLS